MLKLGVLGAGRMGRAILRRIAEQDDCELVGLWLRDVRHTADDELQRLTSGALSTDLRSIAAHADVLLDFTLPGGTAEIATTAADQRVALLCGVSGLDATAFETLARAAHDVPVLYDRNMSIGIALLESLVEQAGAALGTGYRTEIHETHHVHKKDAPSGTALQLGAALAARRGQNFAKVARFDRNEPDRPGDIHFLVTRHGEVPGDHAVHFDGPGESLKLAHSVKDRQVFADGAIRASRWLQGQSPGLYRIRDSLSIA